jgi:hypothetical protein
MLPVAEQETTISYSRDEDTVNVYTSDSTVITKLDKACKSGEWKLLHTHHLKTTGELIAKEYEAPKELISFRTKRKVLSGEQKTLIAERMRARQTETVSNV